MEPEQVAERIWPGRELVLEPLDGGLTNQNFKVAVDGEVVVLRIGGKDSELLAIDRSVEHGASLVASELGIGPEVVGFVEPEGYLVTRFIDGRPIPPEEMRRPETIARAAAVLRRIHDGPPIPGRFDSFRVVEVYAETAAAHGVTGPGRLRVGPRRRPSHRVGPQGARAGRLPQRLPEPELPRRGRRHPDRRLGVRGHGRPLLRPGQLLHQPRVRRRCERRSPRGLFRRATGRGRADAPAHALHVRLPRGHVGRRPAGCFRPRRRLRGLGDPALRPDAANGGGGGV